MKCKSQELSHTASGRRQGKSILHVPDTWTSQYWWILEHFWCTSIAWKCDSGGVFQKLTILECKNGLVLSNTHVPVSGTWSVRFLTAEMYTCTWQNVHYYIHDKMYIHLDTWYLWWNVYNCHLFIWQNAQTLGFHDEMYIHLVLMMTYSWYLRQNVHLDTWCFLMKCMHVYSSVFMTTYTLGVYVSMYIHLDVCDEMYVCVYDKMDIHLVLITKCVYTL